MPALTPIRFLTAHQLSHLYRRSILAASPTQPTLFASALDAPANNFHFGATTSIHALAAILATRLITNHAFMDGNKRVGMLAAHALLKMNGWRIRPEVLVEMEMLDAGNGRIIEAAVLVARGMWDEDELAAFLREISVQESQVCERSSRTKVESR
ncbi:hypothetical protein BDV95DRAFT_605897 [Massariosphaeria phaeospora]|uniref:Fido domain-containing protein n=1 Tax=Massariosphaeria phaeospora TaxID=100035 RepID=A0A7C8IGA3_9PLEO|nr:hypothetical protein BDV95DRAFT_605897 [Massariosphaeria phaeospora]